MNHLVYGALGLGFIGLAAFMVWHTGNDWWVVIALVALLLGSSSTRKA